QGALGRPAMPAACCGAPQVLWPLDAGRTPGLADHDTDRRAQRVGCEPSVGDDQRCCVAWIGLRFPQRPPWCLLRLGILMAKDGEVAHSFQLYHCAEALIL